MADIYLKASASCTEADADVHLTQAGGTHEAGYGITKGNLAAIYAANNSDTDANLSLWHLPGGAHRSDNPDFYASVPAGGTVQVSGVLPVSEDDQIIAQIDADIATGGVQVTAIGWGE